MLVPNSCKNFRPFQHATPACSPLVWVGAHDATLWTWQLAAPLTRGSSGPHKSFARSRLDPLMMQIHSMEQQIDQVLGGGRVSAVKRELIKPDPEGQQYRQDTKH